MNKLSSKTLFLILISTPALAHHPLDGIPMTTVSHGLLAGVGHPILGLDHLFFIVAVGVLACFTGRRFLTPLFYVLGMLGGFLFLKMEFQLQHTDMAIAVTVMIIGGILMSGYNLKLPSAGLLVALAGVFHGLALGEGVIGVEGVTTQTLFGYLFSLCVTQWTISVLFGHLLIQRLQNLTPTSTSPRLTGAVIAGAGFILFSEQIEPLITTSLLL